MNLFCALSLKRWGFPKSSRKWTESSLGLWIGQALQVLEDTGQVAYVFGQDICPTEYVLQVTWEVDSLGMVEDQGNMVLGGFF